MSIEWFRDLVIVIFGLVATGVLILIGVLSYSFYRRTKPILDSLRATLETVQQFSSYLGQEVAKPMIQASALFQGITAGIEAITKLFRR